MNNLYMLELVTPYPNELLLQVYYFTTWTDTSKKIKELQDLDIDNVELNLYKKSDLYGCYNFIDNFKDIRQKKTTFTTPKTKKHYKKALLYTAGAAAAFPVMLCYELTKKK